MRTHVAAMLTGIQNQVKYTGQLATG